MSTALRDDEQERPDQENPHTISSHRPWKDSCERPDDETDTEQAKRHPEPLTRNRRLAGGSVKVTGPGPPPSP